MQNLIDTTDNRHVKGWYKPTLTFSIITVLLGVAYLTLTLLLESGVGNIGSVKAYLLSQHVALVLFALTLVLMVGLFACIASIPLKSVAPWLIVFGVVFVAYAVINVPYEVFSGIHWPGKVEAISFSLMITSVPGALVLLAFLSRRCFERGNRVCSAAVPVALVSLICGFACGLLSFVASFSEHIHNPNGYPVIPGIEKASGIFEGLTYLGISVVLFLLLLPLILRKEGTGLSVTASITGGTSIIFALVWMILLTLSIINDNQIFEYGTAFRIASPLVYIAWGSSLVSLILLLKRKNQIKEVLAENKEQLAELWGLTERLIEVWDEAENIQTTLAEGQTPGLDAYRAASAIADGALDEYTDKWGI
jgi:hypothetical protein